MAGRKPTYKERAVPYDERVVRYVAAAPDGVLTPVLREAYPRAPLLRLEQEQRIEYHEGRWWTLATWHAYHDKAGEYAF